MPRRLAFTINNKTLVIRQRFLFARPPFIFAAIAPVAQRQPETV